MKKVYIERNKLFKNLPMILCNNITEADESFIEDNYELFYDDCEECDGQGEKDGKRCDNCGGDGRYDNEIYQYFLVGINDWDKERLSEYGVELGYSKLLDLYVLPIYDFGTSWSCFSYSKEVSDDYELAHDETLTRSTPY